ncbi:adenylate kinase [Patescibacteria group bacterium]|nr:adenylate kinase [Patescibacteria group bacterium]
MRIVIFGPQGSGKGTQAQALIKVFDIPHITTGELFRNEIKANSEIGKMVASVINTGKLVEDDLTLEVLKKRLEQTDCQKGFILDGFPRNITQAQALDKIVSTDQVIELWIPDDEVINRLEGRRTCKKCETVFNIKTNPPAKENVCDKCGNELIVRNDDKQEAIKKRLELYHQQTEPLIVYYQKQGKLIKIDGRPSISQVTESILAKLK